ncbi:response regulator transcription factor [Anaerocolumna sp. MB42-C2]|uniref:response regulator transcription factor n=1 Tax=Anaerocolumna sp. MB42-C2 TaxID=3070997 RepID=UPI0027E093AA|nr:response regulator transcription factor [Anaerocolumna sp. MB42-C2]WMJ89837.1 response regulator transcription factor [Anaerocolumna sp. MB42-C2]
MAYKILIIEDCKEIQDELKILLTGCGYITCVPNNFNSIIEDTKSLSPDLILLDIGLPVQNGFRVCSEIRNFSTVPIIFVTSHNTDMDELNSITIGGDDFITKPYNTSILLARIASLLKRTYASRQAESITYQGITLYLESCKLEFQNQPVELTKNELKILAFLFKNTGKIIPRADLVEYLWDNQLYIDDNTLSVNITRLRDKLKQIGITDLIKTKHRQGYLI